MTPSKVSIDWYEGRERGFSSLAVVALLFSLTLLGFVVIAYAQSGYYRAKDLYRRLQATYLAEAALTLGEKRMEALIPLDEVSLPYVIVPSETMGDGSFSAVLSNNPDDAGGEYDRGDVLVLKATGLAFGQERRRIIEGAMVVTSPSGEPSGKENLRLAGTNEVLYSQAAISFALDMMPPYRLRSYAVKN